MRRKITPKTSVEAKVSVEDGSYIIDIRGFGVTQAETVEDVHKTIVDYIVERGGSATADVLIDWAAVLGKLRERRWGLSA